MNVNVIVVSGSDYRSVTICTDATMVKNLHEVLCENDPNQPTIEDVRTMVANCDDFFEFGDTYIDVNYAVEVV